MCSGVVLQSLHDVTSKFLQGPNNGALCALRLMEESRIIPRLLKAISLTSEAVLKRAHAHPYDG